MNPFEGTRRPVDSRSELIGREDAFAELQRKMDKGDHAVIMGVVGSGKTSFLRCFFNQEYCRKMAKENHTLIMQTKFPIDVKGDEVYIKLIDRVKDALKLLDVCGMTEEKAFIEKELAGTEQQTGGSRFEGTINAFALCGFRLVYVLDDFERFTTSSQVMVEHHNKMRDLLEATKTQCIVATNYDLDSDSLPPGVKGSFLLMTLAPNKILVSGFSEEESAEYLRREMERSDLEFSENLIKELHDFSGGIPWILHRAAFHAYEWLEQEDIESLKQTDVRQVVYDEMKETMGNWSLYLSPDQVRILKNLNANRGRIEPLDKSAAQLLVKRGILREVYRVNERGRRIKENGIYEYNSIIYRKFCTDADENGVTLMEKAASKNPFRAVEIQPKELSTVRSNAGESFEDALKKGIAEGSFIFNGPVFMPGANQNNTDIHVEQMTLLQSMGDEKQFLTTVEQIMGRITGDSRFSIDRTVDEAALDVRFDEVADEIVSEFVPQLPTPEEMQTLDERFREVRDRGIRTEVTDAFLDSFTEECQFYLKIAVVVEDALRILHTVNLGDFSAQLVMYGKVLEQCLRDSMFELFHTERKLKIWDLYRHKEDAQSTQCFGTMQVNKTFIGNYLFMMRDKKNYLSQLCNNKAIESEEAQVQATAEWNRWWKTLSEDVDAARECRNTADHAGSKSEKDDLTVMCDLLFGEKGIMNRCKVAKKLYDKITP